MHSIKVHILQYLQIYFSDSQKITFLYVDLEMCRPSIHALTHAFKHTNSQEQLLMLRVMYDFHHDVIKGLFLMCRWLFTGAHRCTKDLHDWIWFWPIFLCFKYLKPLFVCLLFTVCFLYCLHMYVSIIKPWQIFKRVKTIKCVRRNSFKCKIRRSSNNKLTYYLSSLVD